MINDGYSSFDRVQPGDFAFRLDSSVFNEGIRVRTGCRPMSRGADLVGMIRFLRQHNDLSFYKRGVASLRHVNLYV